MQDSRAPTILATLAIVAVLAAAAWRVLTATGIVQPTAADLICDVQAGPCSVLLEREVLVTDLTPRPIHAGEELSARVELQTKRGAVRRLAGGEIEFDMPGMTMGDHTFALLPDESGRLTGTVRLTDCPSGHTLWRATIRLPHRPEAQFTFHVAR